MNADTAKSIIEYFAKIDIKYKIPEPKEYSTLINAEDKIICILQWLLKYRKIPEHGILRKKNKKYAHIHQNRGIYKEQIPADACWEFTAAIVHATPNTKQYAIALECRASSWFRLGFYDHALLDMKRSLKSGYPDESKAVLYLAIAKILLAVNQNFTPEIHEAIANSRKWSKCRPIEDQKEIEETLNSLDTFNMCPKPSVSFDFSKLMPATPQHNPKIIGASDKIELKYTEKYGYHIVATKDIRAGDTLTLTKAYAVIPNDKFTGSEAFINYGLCWNCSKIVRSSVPCHQCVIVNYCDEKCRDMAWNEHHDIECNVITAMAAVDMQHNDLMALRLTTKAFKEAGSLRALRDKIKRIDTITGNCIILF